MPYKSSVLITGGTTGLGYECALALARQHPECQIVVASRSDVSSAAATINAAIKQNNVSYMPLDLASLANVRSFISSWEKSKFPPIRALLLNAGLQFPKGLTLTKEGIEATFAVNHVGHALLCHLLLPFMEVGGRIVVTSSGTHDPAQKSGLPDAKYTSGDDLAHPKPESASIDGRQRYATSKLANVLWVYAFQRRLVASQETRLSIVAFDPGLMPSTGLAREYSAFLRFVWNSVLPRMIPVMRLLIHHNVHTPRESGENLADVAMSDSVESGKYFEGKRAIKSSVASHLEKDQEDLWSWTVKHIAETEEEARKFETLH